MTGLAGRLYCVTVWVNFSASSPNWQASSANVLACAPENRRHKVADGFAVNNRIANLSRLLSHQPPPNGVTLRPEIFAFIIKTFGVAIHDNTQRYAIHASTNTAVVQRRPASIATQCDWEGSPMISAPASIINLSNTPWLNACRESGNYPRAIRRGRFLPSLPQPFTV